MFSALAEMLGSMVSWRSQAIALARMDLAKTYKGSKLGWLWLFVRPAVYIGVYWLALSVGLRSGGDVEGKPYLLWLASGVVTWFFVSAMVQTGGNVYRRYPYLVNRIRFPLPVISEFYCMGQLAVLAATLAAVAAAAWALGFPPSIYFLQLPLILLMLFVFWTAWSVLMSPLSALSLDFAKLLKTLGMPLFWLSGIIFHIEKLPVLLQRVLVFNPVAWSVEAVRDCFVYDRWIWEDVPALAAFLAMLVLAVVLAGLSYRRFAKEVPDAI